MKNIVALIGLILSTACIALGFYLSAFSLQIHRLDLALASLIAVFVGGAALDIAIKMFKQNRHD